MDIVLANRTCLRNVILMIRKREPLKITALLLEGSPITAISGPIEMLTIASMQAGLPAPQVSYVSVTGGPTQFLGGLTINSSTHWESVEYTDILIIGACGDINKGSYILPKEVKYWLKKQITQCEFVLSLCTGTFLLAELGVLNKRSATTHWVYAEDFRNQFPQVKFKPHLKITHDDRYICTTGIKEYFAATILLIDALLGTAQRIKCEQYLGGDVSKIKRICLTSFAQYHQHSDSLIDRLQEWMHNEDPSRLSVAMCAEKSFLSERQMKRRFKAATGESPMSYIQRIRVALARDKLDTTSLNIEQISQQVGYSDTNHFRSLFKKFYDMTPTEYRKTTQACEI
ncbi:GlxA family transcriptional regulator [Vibrio splendidus]|uniref:GlxA family transcriptional regulator n=1 Tax=Vibrio splendidus TaxID=29497 RepID=UPI001E33DF5F|nr:helix-turn-helix domain-containing protein [Vibrio splendidus]MCC4860877.1 helix-turn-helix domain-containing protein [Vibrio splendidus]